MIWRNELCMYISTRGHVQKYSGILSDKINYTRFRFAQGIYSRFIQAQLPWLITVCSADAISNWNPSSMTLELPLLATYKMRLCGFIVCNIIFHPNALLHLCKCSLFSSFHDPKWKCLSYFPLLFIFLWLYCKIISQN